MTSPTPLTPDQERILLLESTLLKVWKVAGDLTDAFGINGSDAMTDAHHAAWQEAAGDANYALGSHRHAPANVTGPMLRAHAARLLKQAEEHDALRPVSIVYGSKAAPNAYVAWTRNGQMTQHEARVFLQGSSEDDEMLVISAGPDLDELCGHQQADRSPPTDTSIAPPQVLRLTLEASAFVGTRAEMDAMPSLTAAELRATLAASEGADARRTFGLVDVVEVEISEDDAQGGANIHCFAKVVVAVDPLALTLHPNSMGLPSPKAADLESLINDTGLAALLPPSVQLDGSWEVADAEDLAKMAAEGLLDLQERHGFRNDADSVREALEEWANMSGMSDMLECELQAACEMVLARQADKDAEAAEADSALGGWRPTER